MTSTLCRRLGAAGSGPATFARAIFTPASLAFPIAALLALSPAQAQQSRVCVQLEAQLQAFDRGASDPARTDQIRRFEDAANRQQAELDRTLTQQRQAGCEGTGFFLFGGQPPQCAPLTARIQQQRANLERVQNDLARLQQTGAGPERDAQRRAILVSLSQNDCGPQYRAAATQQPRGNLFDALFGPSSIFSGGGGGDAQTPGSGYRTVCVRTCDGYYYPISFSTTPARFTEDARICQRSCPAAEVMLYTHRNPGEDMNQAVSVDGRPYTALPTAFKYRQAFDSACSCRRPGESWSQALGNVEDQTVERGDIVVNEERARQLSLPRLDAQGKPIRPEPRTPARGAQRPAQPVAAGTPPTQEGSAEPDPKRPVRAVGPTFIPR